MVADISLSPPRKRAFLLVSVPGLEPTGTARYSGNVRDTGNAHEQGLASPSGGAFLYVLCRTMCTLVVTATKPMNVLELVRKQIKRQNALKALLSSPIADTSTSSSRAPERAASLVTV
jgi:hypothetical protein